MNMRLIILTCILGIIIPQSVSALSPTPSRRSLSQPAEAALLQSPPELMECSIDQAQSLWQFPTPITLGAVPCQYLGSIGGPAEGEGSVYSPKQLDAAASAIEVDRSSGILLYEVRRPLDPFAPMQPYGQWFGSPF